MQPSPATRKPKPAPPAVQFEFPIGSLPAKVRAAVQNGAKCTVRQYAAQSAGRQKQRSRMVLLVNGDPVAETEMSWRMDG